MIFALATDEMTLFVFAADEEAVAYCEGIDVEEGDWLFWDKAGTALAAEFIIPNRHGRVAIGNGTYRLVSSPGKHSLLEALSGIRNIDANPCFETLAAVRAHLASISQVSQHGT